MLREHLPVVRFGMGDVYPRDEYWSQVEEWRQRYGVTFWHQWGCLPQAMHAMAIMAQAPLGTPFEVRWVSFGFDKAHAYLLDGDMALSEGVTWWGKGFSNLRAKVLREQGEDYTGILARHFLRGWDGGVTHEDPQEKELFWYREMVATVVRSETGSWRAARRMVEVLTEIGKKV